jgi:hypothetical protein
MRTAKNRLPIRQKFGLLNSKANFADSQSTRFQGLSMTIGRFLRTSTTTCSSGPARKIPSALAQAQSRDQEKWSEEPFGRIKTVGNLRQTPDRGRAWNECDIFSDLAVGRTDD